MIRALLDWLDHRTGHRALLEAVLHEPIPGGARWRYVWGSTLCCTFAVQIITGLCLWTAYSPGVQNAWGSVLYIEQYLWCGRLVRGIHHYAAQAMVVLLIGHVLQVILDGAYRAPRELNYWIGWFMALLVLALALTGYLLPWDQKGYYATQVATKITGATPLVGETAQALLQGGYNYGQLTLTRFFALHAGILPGLLVAALVVHLYLFRRHGIHVRDRDRQGPTGWFWPQQVLRDAIASLAVMVVVVGFAWWRGAELLAPADAAEPYAAARPEWYFLFLFRLLKFEWMEHLGLALGAVVFPGLVVAIFLLMPLLARLPGGHTFNRIFTGLVLAGILGLTGLALYEDATNPEHQTALATARQDAARARQLALGPQRIPLDGPQHLLRDDPLTAGAKLYAAHCASCHLYDGHDGRGQRIWDLDPQTGERVAARPTAPDLGPLGQRAWMRAVLVDFPGLFAPLKNAHWYGNDDGIDPDQSEMADWSGDHQALNSPANARDLDAIVEFLMSESKRPGITLNKDLVARGRELATEGTWTKGIDTACTSCHETMGEPFDPDNEGGTGYPDLAAYLSHEWLVDFLEDAGSPQHYGDRNQMPAYEDRLTPAEIDLLVRWLRGDYVPREADETPETAVSPADPEPVAGGGGAETP